MTQTKAGSNTTTPGFFGNLRRNKTSVPLWFEFLLFSSFVLMISGVGHYFVTVHYHMGESLSRYARYVREQGTYWKIVILLYRPPEIDMSSASGALVITGFVITVLCSIFGALWYNTKGNARITLFISMFVLTCMHMLFYLIGHGIMNPDRKWSSMDDAIRAINTSWVFYVVVMFLFAAVSSWSFVRCRMGFLESVVGGKLSVLVIKVLVCISLWFYALCAFVAVYSININAGVGFIFTSFTIIATIWVLYTVLSVLRGGRTLFVNPKEDPNAAVKTASRFGELEGGTVIVITDNV